MVSGKNKGSAFEREICKSLSLWVSFGNRNDLYWRSAMSGGRATIQILDNKIAASQAGDISAVDEEGFWLIQDHIIELKHYSDINISRSLLTNRGLLHSFWKKLQKDAQIYQKSPILIFRQNYYPIFVVSEVGKPLGYRRYIYREEAVLKIPGWLAELRPLSDVISASFSGF